MSKVDNLTISFMEKDAQQLHHHDDTTVINFSIANFNT